MYCATYNLEDTDIQQIAFKLDTGGLSDRTRVTQFLELCMSFLSQNPNASVSVMMELSGGQFSAHIRLALSGSQSDIILAAGYFNNHPLVSHGLETRESFDAVFENDQLTVRAVPNHLYSAGGIDCITDYVLMPQLNELFNLLHLNQSNFIYQATVAKPDSLIDSIKFVKKSVVRLEEKPGIPEKFLKKQKRLANQIQKTEWIAEEFIAVSDRTTLDQVTDIIQRSFEVEQQQYGFPELALESSDDVDDEYYTGLHSKTFEAMSEAEQACQLVSDRQLSQMMRISLPSAPIESTVMPKPISTDGQYDVFLSHSSVDAAITQAICHYLEAKGIRCWIAPRDIRSGEIWSSEIMAGIKHSKVTVLVLSDSSNSSRYVLREIEQSVSLGHGVLPVRIADIMPSDSLNFFVSSHHWFDAINGNLEEYLPKLYQVILPQIQS